MKDERREDGRQDAGSARLLSAVSFTSAFRLPPSAFVPYLVWSIVAALALGLASLIVIAPLAIAHNQGAAAFVIYEMFGRVCHQNLARSFLIEGHPLAVCARCTGIYFGFAVGVLFYPLVRSLHNSRAPARKWLVAALTPSMLDFGLGFFGLWENTHMSRALTGALLGLAAAFYVVPGLTDLSRMMMRTNER